MNIGCETYTFCKSDEGFQCKENSSYTLEHGDQMYTMTTDDGIVWDFQDCSHDNDNPHGLFYRVTLPGDGYRVVTKYCGHNVETIECYDPPARSPSGADEAATAASPRETAHYQYSRGADGVRRLSKVEHRAGGELLGHATFQYYGLDEPFGTAGDLKGASEQRFQAGVLLTTDDHHFRYDNTHLLLQYVGPDSFRAVLQADGYDPFTAGSDVIARYADNSFQYDADRKVCSRASAGQAATTYSYADNPANPFSGLQAGPLAAEILNLWKLKAVATQADGSQTVTYVNCVGDTLLHDVRNTAGQSAVDYYQYNDNENQTLHAEPTAVAAYVENQETGTLDVTLNADGGTIHLFDYYSSSNAQGAVEGQLHYELVKVGSGGTPSYVSGYVYTSYTLGNHTIYPVASQSSFPDGDVNHPVTTGYQYQWYGGTFQMSQKTTLLPAVPSEQNGTGVSDAQIVRYDRSGRVIQSECPAGRINSTAYDPLTGAVVESIQDLNGLHLVTDYTVDTQGRTTQVLGPVHVVPDLAHAEMSLATLSADQWTQLSADGLAALPATAPAGSGGTLNVRTAQWTVYRDRVDDTGLLWHEVLTARGYLNVDTQRFTLVNPVSISRTAATGRRSEQVQAVRASTAGPLLTTDLFPQSSYVRWSVSLSNNAQQMYSSRAYFAIPAEGDGLANVNYNETLYAYDAQGRQNRTQSPGGTITRTVFDSLGRVIETYVGTNDAAASDADPTGGGLDPENNMVCTASQAYNAPGQLISQTQHVAADASHDRVTTFTYDNLGRQTGTDGPEDTHQRVQYDNLNRQIVAEQYCTGSAGLLRTARSETYYDNRGRVYLTLTYVVDEAGDYSNAFEANTWYDCTGQVIKQQASGQRSFTKYVYDGANRLLKTYTGLNSDLAAGDDPASVLDDTILQQAETIYDDAGNVTESILRQRLPSDSDDQTGELADYDTAPQARVSYTAFWYDGIGRQIAAANYGASFPPLPRRERAGVRVISFARKPSPCRPTPFW